MKRSPIQRILTLCLALVFSFALIPATNAASIVASGYCGDEGDGKNVTWTLDSDGVLTIGGTGEMAYDESGVSYDWDKEKVTEVVIGKSVTYVYTLAFIGELSSRMKAFRVEAGNSVYSANDGVLLTADGKIIVAYPTGSERTTYKVPEGVESLGSWSFDGAENLEKVVISDGVEEIGWGAFLRCTNLKNVIIAPSVKYLCNGAFSGCSSLASIYIPQSVTLIDAYAFYDCTALTDIYYEGSRNQGAAIELSDLQDYDGHFKSVSIHYNSPMPVEQKETVEDTLPTATQYVPYQTWMPTEHWGDSYALTSGSLPEGLSLRSDGFITGFPKELGVFSFTVTETYEGGSTEHKCTLSVYSRMYADVEENNFYGYGFVETAAGRGRVQDQTVSSVSELTDQVMYCEGPFSEFRDLYLDARKLKRGVEYEAEKGSTKITIYAETIGEEGGGTHTLAAEFETDGGETAYTVQNYTVYGIASREVHVEVKGETVIWTDAEPYIDENNRTMTPFRVVGEALGLTIAWDSSTREASFSNGTKTIYFPIESTTARTSAGTTITMDTSAVIVNGRTYAPVRYLAQYFGYSVGWDAPTRTVVIG